MNDVAEREMIDEAEEGQIIAQGSMALVAALNKSEIDQAITTARAHPRSLRAFINQTTEMVTLNQQVATECIYNLRRGGKVISGASVRFAEIAAYAWGNNRSAARVVREEARMIYAQGLYMDVQKNSAVTIEVGRRITNSEGERYGDDMIAVTGNAAVSIALRNCILRGIPKAIWFPLYNTARATVAGDVKTMPARRKDMFAMFKEMGVEPRQLYSVLDVQGDEDIGIDQFVTLAALLKSFKEGGPQAAADFFAQREATLTDQTTRPVKGKGAGKAKVDEKKTPPAKVVHDGKDANKTNDPKVDEKKPENEEPPAAMSDNYTAFRDQVDEATVGIALMRIKGEAEKALPANEFAALQKRIQAKSEELEAAANAKKKGGKP